MLESDPFAPDKIKADSMEKEEELGIMQVMDQLEEVTKNHLSR